MRPSEAIARHRQALLEMARRYGVSNVRVFGSVARGEDGEGAMSICWSMRPAERPISPWPACRMKRNA